MAPYQWPLTARKREAIPYPWLHKVMEERSVSADWLLFGLGRMEMAEPGGSAQIVEIETNTGPGISRHSSEGSTSYGISKAYTAGQLVLIPKALPIVDEDGVNLVLSDEVAPLAFQHFWLSRKGDIDRMVLLQMTGDHMEPTLRQGELLLVDTTSRAPVSGSIHALSFGRDIVIKRVDRLPGKLLLLNDNPARPPYEVSLDDQFQVLGRVIWSAKNHC